MTTESKTINQTAIAANLAALTQRLTKATALAQEAQEALAQGEQNQAIGTILDFEYLLPEAQALYNAAITLHRSRG
jgi:hypothetical protein